MSITSSATTSRDWEVPSPNSFHDRLCLLSITRGDGTPMDASSISEEDIVEICIQKGHTCPLGVLQYLAAESIILFGTKEDLNWASHDLMGMMELCDEAITVWTMALLEAHGATFTMMWHSKPTIRDGEPHTPPQQTPPSEGTLHHLHAELGDLNDKELQQLVQDLMQKIVQHELTVPPSNPLLMTGYAHWAVEPEEDDQEVTFSRRGKVGSIEATYPSFRATSWGKGSLWTTTATAMSCTSRTRHGAANYHPNIGSAHQYPKNKYLQWRCGTQ